MLWRGKRWAFGVRGKMSKRGDDSWVGWCSDDFLVYVLGYFSVCVSAILDRMYKAYPI